MKFGMHQKDRGTLNILQVFSTLCQTNMQGWQTKRNSVIVTYNETKQNYEKNITLRFFVFDLPRIKQNNEENNKFERNTNLLPTLCI